MGNTILDKFLNGNLYKIEKSWFLKHRNCRKFKIISALIYVSVLLYAHKAKSIQKFREFWIRIFPGFSGSGFFLEKNSVRTCAKSNSLPIFCPLLLHKFYKQFGLVEECGEHEKCKKHTFLGVTVIFKKKLIT